MNRNLAISLLVVCTQLQIGYGIMAASMSVLRPFIAVYEKDSTYPANSAHNTVPRSTTKRTNNTKSNTSFQLRSILHRGHNPDRSNRSPSSPAFPPDLHDTQTYTASVSHQQPPLAAQLRRSHEHPKTSPTTTATREDAGSVESGDSKPLMIVRHTDWSVRYDGEDSVQDALHIDADGG